MPLRPLQTIPILSSMIFHVFLRFASFIEGNSHLSDEEILEYETSIQGELTDEEYDDDLTDEDED